MCLFDRKKCSTHPFFSYFSSPNGTPTIPYTRTLTSFVVIHGTMKKSLRLHCKLWSRFLYTKFSLNWENRRRKGEGKALIGKCWVETFRLFIYNLLCCEFSIHFLKYEKCECLMIRIAKYFSLNLDGVGVLTWCLTQFFWPNFCWWYLMVFRS